MEQHVIEQVLASIRPGQHQKLNDSSAARLVAVLDNLISSIELLEPLSSPDLINLLPESSHEAKECITQYQLALKEGKSYDIKRATKSALRAVSKDENASRLIATSQTRVGAGLSGLLDELSRLRQVLYRKVLSSVEEQRQQRETIQRLASRNKSHQQEVSHTSMLSYRS